MRAEAAKRLTALIENCAASGVTRQALLLRTDRLPTTLSRPHHLRLAEAALSPLLGVSRAQLFHLPGPRFAVTWRGDAESVLMDVVESLDHLLEDAPIGTPSLRELVFLYDLPTHGDLLKDALSDSVAPQVTPLPAPGVPLDPAGLATLEAALAQADVARFARRHPVWRMGRREAALAWEKRTLSVGELASGLLPGHDLHAAPWLFRRLTRTLDRRMLSLLASPGELTHAGPFALDLNVASVLSPEFLRFDAALPGGLRGRVVIALMPADVMADPATFAFARGFARARGYRLLLRDVTPPLARLLSLPALELDHLQLCWSPDLMGQDAAADAQLLVACAPERTVLALTNDRAALAWGLQAGIRLFQGSAADDAALGERSVAA
jgi:hypothetical protein